MKPCWKLRPWIRCCEKAVSLLSILISLTASAQNPDNLNTTFNNSVQALAVQSDGSLLAGGSFTLVAGSGRNGVGRLNPDTFLDIAFNPGLNSPVNVTAQCLAIQPDGMILLGGTFTNMGSLPRNRLARLTADGVADFTFNPGANTNVHVIALQPDGKILVAGSFTNLAGQARAYLGRLLATGSLDETFLPVLDAPVHTLLVQPDGKILLGGDFTTVDGLPREHLARLDTTGALDLDFNPGADGAVYCFAMQADNRIIVGGSFTNLGGQLRQRLARVEDTGALDPGFAPNVSGEIRSLALQADGKVFAGGNFTNVNGLIRSNLVRFDATGAVDNFSPNPNNVVHGLALQADGKLLVGGNFTAIGGSTRTRLARLTNDIPTSQSLTLAASTLIWLRGGSGPEVYRAAFSYSTNGADWMDLPTPTRIAGGWQLTGVSLSASATIRARGEVRGGYNNSSSWFIEASTGPLAISRQPDDQVSNSGGSVRFSVTPAGPGPFTYRWYRNGVLISTSSNPTHNRTAGTSDVGTSYEVVVSNAVSTVRSRIATIWVPSADAFDGNLNNTVNAILPQPDGSIVVGGVVSVIARFNPDGTFDSTFSASVNGTVNCLAPQTNGMILAAGAFTTVAGQTRNRLARLDSVGKVDLTFNPNANGTVNAMAVQPDGKILIGGAFLTVGGVSHPYLARLNTDGTPDNTFNPFANGIVHSLAVQPDGMLVVGGTFTMMNGTTRNRIARLQSDGTLDPSFNPGTTGTVVSGLALQADGKILVTGSFSMLGGQLRQGIGRLHSNGTIDLGFNPGVNGSIATLQLQADGRIWVGGTFSSLAGVSRNNLARLNPDGTVDPVPGPATSGAILGLALQADGKLIAGGSFTTLFGSSRSRLGRLNNTSAATQNLTTDGSSVTWLRGGSGPEINRAAFAYCTNGTDWIELPTPERITNGWRTANISIPLNATVRARGYANGSFNTGSDYFIETGIGPTVIDTQPTSQAMAFASSERLSVTAIGAGPFTYQWYRDGVALAAATNSWLVVPGLQATFTYDVVVTGPDGSVRSQPASIWTYGTDLSFNPGADEAVYAMAVQPDLKILISGAFTNSPGSGIARLHASGSRDTNFNPSVSGGLVLALAVQTDGKIVVGGTFTNLNGQSRNAIGRLNADGSLDTGFNPGATGFSGAAVQCLAIQPDGKILVGGNFAFLAGQSRYCLGRLNDNGSLDTGFVPPAGGGGSPGTEAGVTSLIFETNGNILVMGELKEPNPFETTYVQRLDSLGNRISRAFYNFGPPSQPTYIMCAAAQPDGGIILGGWFDWIESGQLHRNLARLDPSGFLDLNFTNIADGPVTALAGQADGKILVGGAFSNIAGQARNRLARLDANGNLDTAFDLPLTGSGLVQTLALQPDGKILVGGSFTNLATRARNNIGRLNNLEFGTDRLSQNGGIFLWQRSNVSPEVTPTILEASTDGVNWSNFGAGTRVPDGWQWTVAVLPADALIRVRGSVGGGESFWFAESFLPTASRMAPIILTNAGSLGFGSNSFGLHVDGSFGHLVVVDASTNLVNWTPVQTNRLLNPPTLFTDPAAPNFPQRFYRARLQ